jgi:spore germination cell wall hydrolase CwlJ-like protein
VQHVSGTTLANTTVSITGSSYIYGQESGVNTAFTTASLLSTTIVPEEQVYWTSLTYYDYERQKNEYNKTIQILDNRYSRIIVDNIKTLLSNT